MRKGNAFIAKEQAKYCYMFLFLALLTSSSGSWRVELSIRETRLRFGSDLKSEPETRLDGQPTHVFITIDINTVNSRQQMTCLYSHVITIILLS